VFVALDFIDMSIPRTIYKELKFFNVGAVATTSAFLIASLFTIFSASLFQELTYSLTMLITLRANQSFDSNPQGSSEEALSIASLILESNLTYPRFTYGDVAFPQLALDPAWMAGAGANASTVSITAVGPALRSRSDCRIYDSSQIRTNLNLSYTPKTPSDYKNQLAINIEGDTCKPIEDPWWPDQFVLSTRPNLTYFGIATDSTP
jgi:hypothetical protein